MTSITLSQSITRREIDGQEINAVDARLLHKFLENGDQFSKWIKERITQYGMVEGFDYVSFSANAEKPSGDRDSLISANTEIKNRGDGGFRVFALKPNRGGRPATEYALTIDAAKELCMVERNAKGKAARMYFIEMERKAKSVVAAVMTIPTDAAGLYALSAALSAKLAEQQEQIKSLEPRADFADAIGSAVNCVTLQEFAKSSGICGPHDIFKLLRKKGILFYQGKTCVPKQIWLDRGYFRLIERLRQDRGENIPYFRTLVTGKGQEWLFNVISGKQGIFDMEGQVDGK